MTISLDPSLSLLHNNTTHLQLYLVGHAACNVMLSPNLCIFGSYTQQNNVNFTLQHCGIHQLLDNSTRLCVKLGKLYGNISILGEIDQYWGEKYFN